MRVFAAIDLRGGEAVQLVGGDPADERIRIPDPVEVAERWVDAGFRSIHVVDLDAAFGDGENRDVIRAIAAVVRARTDGDAVLQVGGGIRDEHAVRRILDLGADRAVIGTRAVEDRPWLERAAASDPDCLVVAADVMGREIVTRGWREGTAQEARAFVSSLDDLPLAGILVTDVGREGRQEGADRERFRELAAGSRHPIIAAGGVTTTDDIASLKAAGIAGVVLGMALYTGRIDPAAALGLERDDS